MRRLRVRDKEGLASAKRLIQQLENAAMDEASEGTRDQALTPALNQALRRLLRAREYARDIGGDPWQFAVEWKTLRALGLERADMRWLAARGLVERHRELSAPGAFRRDFDAIEAERCAGDTSFLLTEAGVWALVIGSPTAWRKRILVASSSSSASRTRALAAC